MRTKAKQSKPKAKRPKPNLHGPNSPTPKKKVLYYDQDDEEPGETLSSKDDYVRSEN
jgi:hypothetical protein